MDWEPLQKPNEIAENRLIEAILSGRFAIGASLPGERELAALLGVTRPTLREALQRLARDGWVEIRHGLPTRVRDYWREGQLAVLVAMVQYPERLPADIVPNLLAVRLDMAPSYTARAVERSPAQVADLLQPYPALPDTPEDFTTADWRLQHTLTILSGNPVYTLLLNGFQGLYAATGLRYFADQRARAASRTYYTRLLECARSADADSAARITRAIMAASIDFWRAANSG